MIEVGQPLGGPRGGGIGGVVGDPVEGHGRDDELLADIQAGTSEQASSDLVRSAFIRGGDERPDVSGPASRPSSDDD